MRCIVCRKPAGEPCINPCTGELRGRSCIGRVERRSRA